MFLVKPGRPQPKKKEGPLSQEGSWPPMLGHRCLATHSPLLSRCPPPPPPAPHTACFSPQSSGRLLSLDGLCIHI